MMWGSSIQIQQTKHQQFYETPHNPWVLTNHWINNPSELLAIAKAQHRRITKVVSTQIDKVFIIERLRRRLNRIVGFPEKEWILKKEKKINMNND